MIHNDSGHVPEGLFSGPAARLDFRELFDAAPGPFLVLLPDEPVFTIAAVNKAYSEATFTKPEEIIGRGIFEVFPDNPADPAATGVRNLKASLREVLATRAKHAMPVQKYDIRLPDGGFEARYWSPINTPLLGPNGEVRFIIHRAENVTELVSLRALDAKNGKVADELRIRADQMEAELFLTGRQLAEAQRLIRERDEVEVKLAASEARFSVAFAEAPIGMVLLTPEGRILEVNQAFVTMLGYTREELATRESAFFTHPDDIELTRNFFRELREGPRNTGSIEKRYFRKGGGILWSRASSTMRRDAAGKPTQVVAIVEDITERKLAEERLWESKEQLRAIYDGTYEYIGLLAPDGTLLDCNRASLEFAGNSRAEVIGLPFWKTPWFAATAGAPDQVREGVARAASGEFVRYEAPLIHPSGAVLTFDFSLHPLRNERGEVVSIVQEGRNITDRKQAEERDAFLVGLDDVTRPLNDAREIIQTAAQMLGIHLKVNRCAYADVEEDENTFNLLGDYNNAVSSIVGRYTFADFGEECLRLMRAGQPYVVGDSETDARTASAIDSYRRTNIRAVICVPLLKAGRFVSAMAVHQKTPRNWTESEIDLIQLVASRCWESIERVHVSRELEEREQRFRFLAESIPQMVFTATPDGSTDYLNDQGCRFFGLPQAELLGNGWLAAVHPDDRGPTAERWQHSVNTGEPFEITNRLKRGSDGSWRWHLLRARPLTNPAGVVLQWFGTCTDIAEQRNIEEELRRTNRELEEFAYVASHDLQEPLRMVNIYTELVLRGLAGSEAVSDELAQYGTFVRQGVLRMEALIQDLLTFSRSVQNDEIPAGSADLGEALQEARSVLRNRLSETGAVITSTPLPSVRGDTAQLAHVFQNILSNALKYRRPDVAPEIDISVRWMNHRWRIAVRDNGIGFEPRFGERIFGLFKRLHKDEYPGTGLGLAICKRIVERYGGQIWAEGRPGEGATFYFSLASADAK